MWKTLKRRWYLLVCVIFDHLRQRGKSNQIFQRISNLYPRSLTAYTWMGWAYQQRDKYEEAIPYFENALQMNQDYAYPHAGLGWSFLHLGRFQEALNSFHRATRIDPGYGNDSE